MSLIRVCCPDCQRPFPIQIDEQQFTCPRCGGQHKIVRDGKRLGWTTMDDPAPFRSQAIHPFTELLEAPVRGKGQRVVGAARARHLLREQRKIGKHRNYAPILAGILILCGLLGWHFFQPGISFAFAEGLIPVEEIVPVTGSLATVPATSSPGLVFASPQIDTIPTNTPTPFPSPSPTVTPLAPNFVQATAWQATIEAAAATSSVQQTANAAHYQATQTVISARFTAVASSRQATATQKVLAPTQTSQAKKQP